MKQPSTWLLGMVTEFQQNTSKVSKHENFRYKQDSTATNPGADDVVWKDLDLKLQYDRHGSVRQMKKVGKLLF